MKIYVINVKRQTERKKFIEDQLISLGIDNYEFVDAIESEHLDLNKCYNKRLAKRFYRELSLPEIAVSCSHLKCYKKIIESGERSIIIEDDCELTDEFNKIKNLQLPDNIDICFFGYFTSNIQNEHVKELTYDSELCSEIPNERGDITKCYFKNIHIGELYQVDEQSYKVDYMTGSHAYSLSLEMCEKFLKIHKKIIFNSDMVWNHLHHFEIDAALYAPLTPWVYQSIDEKIFNSGLVYNSRNLYCTEPKRLGGMVQRISSPNFGI
jgi:GR25 family glycosyltransferase involved in LPS biosynthesis